MLLSETDADLLEFVALSEPWSIVCGEFCPRYGSIETLVARLATFEHAEFLTIQAEPGAPAPTAQALLADAADNGLYEDVIIADGPSWNFTATDLGFAAVRDRLKEQ